MSTLLLVYAFEVLKIMFITLCPLAVIVIIKEHEKYEDDDEQ